MNLIDISSIMLALAMLPEIIKLYNNNKDVLSLSPYFLSFRAISFVIFGLGFYLKKDKSVYNMIYLSIYYVVVYTCMLILYFMEKKKLKK